MNIPLKDAHMSKTVGRWEAQGTTLGMNPNIPSKALIFAKHITHNLKEAKIELL